jgi:D-apionolactonase
MVPALLMGELSRFQLWYGRDEPPVETRELRAGPLTMILEGADLRYVRLGEIEVLRRLYAAVRDRNWGTVPAELSRFELDARDDSFQLSFDARHAEHDIAFRWRGVLHGSPEGTIEYSLDGVAESDFLYNRIGFCLLHPPGNAARPYHARSPEATIRDRLPDTIGPQHIVDGLPAPLFPPFDELEIELENGVSARFDLEGDLFEMEDQRNWTDASFKTYSTPLSLGFPHQASRGQHFAQRVRISLAGAFDPPRSAPDEAVRIRLGRPLGRRPPALGLGMASHGDGLSRREAKRLSALRLDHLRADVKPSAPGWEAELDRATAAAAAVGATLELAVFLGEEPEPALAALAARLDGSAISVTRVLVFREGEPTTAAQWITVVRERLRPVLPDARFFGGTNVLFTDLNRFRPDLEPLDGVAYPLNATVHATDDKSVVETMAMHADTVRSARAFCGDLPIAVTPVTFNQRFNPVATGPQPEPAAGELPPQVDPRQCSLLGAGWTLGTLKYLAEGGADSVTYFETTGWRGIMEVEQGSPAPERFPSRPGWVFPMYHVFGDLADWRDGELLEARSSDGLAVEALAMSTPELHVLVANLTPRSQRCVMGPLAAASVTIRRLDEETAAEALEDPEAFRRRAENAVPKDEELELDLAPFAVLRIDAGRR